MASWRLTLAAAVLCASAALAAGCGGGPGGAGDGAAGIVPASASAYISVDTNLQSMQWQTVDELASHFPDRQKAIDAAKRDLKKKGIEYDRDLRAALGPELDLVWLDLDNDGQDVVGLLQPADEAAFKRLVEKGNAKSTGDKLVYGKVGDWTVAAAKQSLIDRFRTESDASGPKLSDDATFQRAISAVADESLVKAYVSGQNVMDALRVYFGRQADKLIAEAGTLDWIVTDLRASSDGIRFDTVVRGTAGKLFRNGAGSNLFEAKLPQRVPGDALLYLTFHGTHGALGGLGAAEPQLSKSQLRLLRGVGSLLEGENALYVRRQSSGGLPEVTLVTEPQAGTNGAEMLGRLLRKSGMRPRSTSIKGVPASRLGLGGLAIYFANVAGNLVVTDLPSGILSLGAPSSTLSQSTAFNDAVDTSGLPKKTQGFLYVNVRGGVALAERLSKMHVPSDVKRNLSPLRSAVEYALTRPSELQITFFVRIS